MNIISINAFNYASTGNIMVNISKKAELSNHNAYIAIPEYELNKPETYQKQIYIGTRRRWLMHSKLGKLTGMCGCFSFFDTLKLLKKIDGLSVDIIHLHNLHGFYINLPLLFKYIKKHNIKVVWTLHDCWSFTGHCPYFEMVGCDKWKTGCRNCPQYKDYPKSFFDNSKFMYSLKRRWFTGVNNMTLVTPSKWLSSLAKQSFLKDYPVKVINNGIDLGIFKPTESDFRVKHGLENKKIVLGVAFDWGKRKGLDVFIRLAEQLGDDYRIVLVGTDDNVDKLLPENIISVHKTQNQTELAEIYTAADVFATPTREENYPTVNMESLACGTPVLTFNTGGSPEIPDATCGSVVEKDDFETFKSEVIRICKTKPYSKEACLKRAESFDKDERFKEYIELYGELNEEN